MKACRRTQERLRQVDRAEGFLRDGGFRTFRVRYHGDLARIEVSEDDLARFLDAAFRKNVVHGLRELGFLYVTLDLQGYRMGNMNEPLIKETRSADDLKTNRTPLSR